MVPPAYVILNRTKKNSWEGTLVMIDIQDINWHQKNIILRITVLNICGNILETQYIIFIGIFGSTKSRA